MPVILYKLFSQKNGTYLLLTAVLYNIICVVNTVQFMFDTTLKIQK